jgi:hypothetical protein
MRSIEKCGGAGGMPHNPAEADVLPAGILHFTTAAGRLLPQFKPVGIDWMNELAGGNRRTLAARLFAEFVIIVTGVLVALGVNAAWEVRSERQQEEAYYRALVRDLEADTAEYAIALRMTGRSLETAEYVRSVILGRPANATRTLSKSLFYASWVNYPDWSSGTMEELYGAGTIRLIRDEPIKAALHSYRALVSEWRPRIEGPEYSAFQEYRRLIVGLIPLEAAIAYQLTGLDDESVEGVHVDEEALARRIRGDVELLRATERMILEWTDLVYFYKEQVGEALKVLNLLKDRVGNGPS